MEKAAETNSATEEGERGLLLCESYDSNYARMLTIIWILNDLITSGLCSVMCVYVMMRVLHMKMCS